MTNWDVLGRGGKGRGEKGKRNEGSMIFVSHKDFPTLLPTVFCS